MLYKYNEATFDISTIPCEDGDVIISVHNFPLTTTVYLTNEDAQKLALQLADAVYEANIRAQHTKEAA